MSSAPYIPFYTSDFLAGTGGMTASTKGVYITLICLTYEYEGPIPQSWASLARRCGASNAAFKNAVEELVEDGKVEVTEGGIWCLKCEKHITYRREKRSQARDAANSRWEKTFKKQRTPDADALRTQCQPEPEPYTQETSVSCVPRKPPKRKTRLPEDAEITDGMRRAAEKRGHSQQEAEAQFQKFKNDALAKGKTFVEWDRAFVTWLDSPYFRPITTRNTKDGSAAARAQRIGERYAAKLSRDMDSGPDRNSVVPLLPARNTR